MAVSYSKQGLFLPANTDDGGGGCGDGDGAGDGWAGNCVEGVWKSRSLGATRRGDRFVTANGFDKLVTAYR